MTVLSAAYSVLMIILLFGIIIFVHELGHFLAARWMGLVVDTFSIGMGPAIWKKKWRGVTYKIGAFPIGGYVALPQLDPELGMKRDGEEEAEGAEKRRELPPLPPWKKIPVLLAGVTGNVILAFLIAVIIFWAGKDEVYTSDGAVIGFIDPASSAYEYGLRMGDRILTVNENAVRRWDDFMINAALTDEAHLEILAAGGAEKTLVIPTTLTDEGVRMIPGVAKSTPCLVIGVVQDSSADRAGIRRRDVITHLDGEPLMSQQHMMELVDQSRGKAVTLTIRRSDETLAKTLTAAYDEELGRALIGVQFNPFDIYRRPVEQLAGWTLPIFRLLAAFVTPSEARIAAGTVGGPISIFKMFWWSTQASFLMTLWFAGLISMSLAVLNILPVPVLDGGHLAFTFVEIIRRKPLPAKVMSVVHTIFIVLLLSVMLLVTFNDILRLDIGRLWRTPEEPGVPTAVEDSGPAAE